MDINTHIEQAFAIEQKKRVSYMELLPEDGNFTEDDLWEAIAEANGVDYSEIADGDLAEWL
jgi:hypothetical protein